MIPNKQSSESPAKSTPLTSMLSRNFERESSLQEPDKDLAERPDTPLQFPAPPSSSWENAVDPDKTVTSSNMRAQVFTQLDRPEVDPAIRGIPQGWEDSLTRSDENVVTLPPSVSARQRRLPLFKESRAKLLSLNGVVSQRINRQMERKSSGESQTASGEGLQDRALNLAASSPTIPAWDSEHIPHRPTPLQPYGGVLAGEQVHKEGWRVLHSSRVGSAGKKIWVDKYGQDIAGVYRVGWEREVLDLLHETMCEVVGRHTFVDDAPTAVLDIGTGIGLWPISQALIWPQTTFVGLDLVPCQVDLTSLASAERNRRSASVRREPGFWEGIEKRITWERANFLERLPYHAGVFDMVHIRFVGLGVPETKWGDLVDEATRVLKPGGKLEIVEMSYTLPSAYPPSLRNSFASLLLADLIQPIPLLPLRLVVHSTPGLKATFEPVYERTWTDPPDALRDAVMVWVTSSLAYKATGIVRKRQSEDGLLRRVQRELHLANSKKWVDHSEELQGPSSGDRGVSVWAWVGVKGYI